MKTLKLAFIFIVCFLALGVIYSALASANYEKYDGDCTGLETVGRCADKCPEPTTQGTYYLMGYGKHGEAICGISYYNECPHAHVDLHSALCRKLAEQNDPEEPAPVVQEESYGK